MAKADIIVIGSGGHAKVVIDSIEKQNKYNIIGLIDSFQAVGVEVYGYKVIGDESILGQPQYANAQGVVAIGDNWDRSNMVDKIHGIQPKFSFITVIHPFSAIARGIIIGEGTVVMPGSIINSNTKIGKHCVINTKASLDHDNQLGNFVSVAPGSTTGGRVVIDDFSTVSIGACVIQDVHIGKHSLVGAGAVVVGNVDNQSIYYGVPARLMRQRKIGEKYI